MPTSRAVRKRLGWPIGALSLMWPLYACNPHCDILRLVRLVCHCSVKVSPGASEEHEQSGGRLKGIIFGGLDGILTSFAILAGSVGADLGPVAMLALGASNVVADALSMGVGEFLSSRSYSNYVRKERDREMWELQNYPEGEINEMIDLFVARGMSREDAEVVIHRMAKYKEFFVDIMMTEELALPVPSEGDSLESLKDGATMCVLGSGWSNDQRLSMLAAPVNPRCMT